jgi:hypothetical protein
MKTITLTDFLTEKQIRRAIELKDRKKVRDELIIPNMTRINEKLGQENDPDYLSFAIEYVLTRTGHWK